MTAAELHDAIQDVPAECLCGTIRYNVAGWFDEFSCCVSDDHAAALQRDAMTEYVLNHDDLEIELFPFRSGWRLATASGWSDYPTRLHALAAAVRFVAGQKEKA